MYSTTEILAQYAVLLNKHGPDSDEARSFLESHQDNSDFVEMAEISRVLKKALMSPSRDTVTERPQWS